MSDKSNDEQHNALMDYPCDFTIKTMGLAGTNFEIIALEIVVQHAPEVTEASVKSKLSKTSKFISVSISLTAQNKQQMDAIYQDLSDCEQVLMSL